MKKALIDRSPGFAQRMSEDEIIVVAKFYKNFSEFKNKESNLYQELKNRGIRDKVRELVQKEYGYVKGHTCGRRLTDDFLRETALKYKTLSDFQNEDGSVYQTLRRKGLLKEYTSHIISSKAFSKPQRILFNILNQLFNREGIYNDRSIIKPFELDIFYPDFNLALEYNGIVWHSSEEDKEKDLRKANLCESVKVNLLVIREVSRDYEKDIKDQLISFLDHINNITGLKLQKESVESIIVDYDKVYETISLDNIEEKIQKYNTVRDFRKSNHFLYTVLKGAGKDHLFKNLKKRSYKKQNISDEEFLSEVISKQFKSYTEFSKSKYYSYLMSSKKNLIQEIKLLFLENDNERIKENKERTTQQLLEEALLFEKYEDFVASSIYLRCNYRNLTPQICHHFNILQPFNAHLFSNEELLNKVLERKKIFPQIAREVRKEVERRGLTEEFQKICNDKYSHKTKWARMSNEELIEFSREHFSDYSEFFKFENRKFYKYCWSRGVSNIIKGVIQDKLENEILSPQ